MQHTNRHLFLSRAVVLFSLCSPSISIYCPFIVFLLLLYRLFMACLSFHSPFIVLVLVSHCPFYVPLLSFHFPIIALFIVFTSALFLCCLFVVPLIVSPPFFLVVDPLLFVSWTIVDFCYLLYCPYKHLRIRSVIKYGMSNIGPYCLSPSCSHASIPQAAERLNSCA